MLSFRDFEKWLRAVQTSAPGLSYRELEAREDAAIASTIPLEAQFQEICSEFTTVERNLQVLRSTQLPWWQFWAKGSLGRRISEEDGRLSDLASAKRGKYAELHEANRLVREIEEQKSPYRGVPEIWRKREATFSVYSQKEYDTLKRIQRVSSFWISNGALVAETKPMICTGIDTDGSPLARLLGVLRVSFLPWADPLVLNTTRVVYHNNDTWDAPHHPRKMGSCWNDKGTYGLLVAQGEIADAVDRVLSALSSAKPLTVHEQWGVPILKLFPEANVRPLEIEF